MPRQVKVKRSEVVVDKLELQQHEIDNAKQRLATAKSKATAASTNLKSAQTIIDKAKSMKDKARIMMEAAISAKESADEMGIIATSNMSSAQSQYDTSQKELEEAEKCLANAELKLNEVDQQYGSNKRRKSSHPQGNTTISDNSTVNDQETEHGESEPTNVGGTSSSSCPSSSNDDATHPSSIANHSTLTNSQPRTELVNNDKQGATAADAEKKVLDSNDDRPETQQRKVPPPIVHELKTSNIGQGHQNTAIVTAAANSQNDSSMSDVVQIEVEGCGMPKINGSYLRVAGVLNDGAPVYRNEVMFGGYMIFRQSQSFWYIGFPTKPFYTSTNNATSLIPPEKGWIVGVNGVNPVPTCRLLSSQEAITDTAAGHIAASINKVPTGQSSHNAKSSTTQKNISTGVTGMGIGYLPGKNDVLYGQVGVVNNLLKLCDTFKDRYRTAISTHEKSLVITDVLNKWRSMSPPGRFLKKEDDAMWYDVSNLNEVWVREKIARCLREQVQNINMNVAIVSTRPNDSVYQVIVNGSGILEVNGVYNRLEVLHGGALVYTKRGLWKGEMVDFAIFRKSFGKSNHWYIGYWLAGIGLLASSSFYMSHHNANDKTPPEDGWTADNNGQSPAPKCQLIRTIASTADQINANSGQMCTATTDSQPDTKSNNDKQGTTAVDAEKVLDNSDQPTKAQEQRKVPLPIAHNVLRASTVDQTKSIGKATAEKQSALQDSARLTFGSPRHQSNMPSVGQSSTASAKQYDPANYQPQMPSLPPAVSNDQSWEEEKKEEEEEHDTPSAAVADQLDNTCVISHLNVFYGSDDNNEEEGPKPYYC